MISRQVYDVKSPHMRSVSIQYKQYWSSFDWLQALMKCPKPVVKPSRCIHSEAWQMKIYPTAPSVSLGFTFFLRDINMGTRSTQQHSCTEQRLHISLVQQKTKPQRVSWISLVLFSTSRTEISFIPLSYTFKINPSGNWCLLIKTTKN